MTPSLRIRQPFRGPSGWVVGALLPALALAFVIHATPLSAQPTNRPAPRGPVNRQSPPAGQPSGPGRPMDQPHLSQWMESHRNLPLSQQQNALEAEPGFRELKPQEQQRMRNLVTRLNTMPPEQRQRTIARTEWMERLQPVQRQQVRGAMAQLGSLPPERARAVGRLFRSLQSMPQSERQNYLNSPPVSRPVQRSGARHARQSNERRATHPAAHTGSALAQVFPQLLKKFFARNSTFAGRSASRRMKYGYHSGPNGT